MADGTIIVSVTAVLTAGVLGPLIQHHIAKDRESLVDLRDALDSAIEPLSKVRAQSGWLQDVAFDPHVDHGEVLRRQEELLHQTLLVEAHGVKLRLRFGDAELADSYWLAGGAANEQASIIWRRRRGLIPTRVQYDQEMAVAEHTFVVAYETFIAQASAWHSERNWPYTLFL